MLFFVSGSTTRSSSSRPTGCAATPSAGSRTTRAAATRRANAVATDNAGHGFPLLGDSGWPTGRCLPLEVLVQHRRQKLGELRVQATIAQQVVDERGRLIPHLHDRFRERLRKSGRLGELLRCVDLCLLGEVDIQRKLSDDVIHRDVDDADAVLVTEALVQFLHDLFQRGPVLFVNCSGADGGDRV